MNPRHSILLRIAVVTLTLLCAAAAQATLIGDDVVIRRISGGIPTVHTFNETVVAGVIELEFQGRHDLEASSILIDWNIAGLGGIGFDSTLTLFQYLDLDEQGGPSDLTALALTTNVTSFDSSRVSFTADSVEIDLTGLSVVGPDNPNGFSYIDLALTFTPTPEPASALLVGAGLGALAYRSRRRQRG